jgi:rhodanese-related sulfurtransferase
MTGPPGESIAPADLRRRLQSAEPPALLDVREPPERALCAIPIPGPPSAIRDLQFDIFIPLRQIPAHVDRIAALAASRTVVLYCHHGVRSELARRWLADRGVPNLLNLDGGIDAYSLEADPSIPRY